MLNVRVACIPFSRIVRSRLSDALGGPQHVVEYTSAADALNDITRGTVRCTVFDLQHSAFEERLQDIHLLKQAVPSHPIVARVERKPPLEARELVEAIRAGVARIAFADTDDTKHSFSSIITEAMQFSHGVQVLERVGPRLPPPIYPLFKYAVENSAKPLDVSRVAAGFGVTRQTLRNRLRQHCQLDPLKFLTWCRLLVASSMLEDRGQTLDAAGFQLEFASGHYLGTVMKRYVGRSVSELREIGIYAYVEARFLDEASPSDGLVGL